jgi:catechol 2,3-dioxygenase-like lactoylglutathione lyase family enzyme
MSTMTTRARRCGTLVELHVPDLALAKRFYRRFGFRVARYEPPVDDNGYLVLQGGDALLCFWGGTRAVRASVGRRNVAMASRSSCRSRT